MDIIAIGLICAVGFGVVIALSAFVRQLMVSRDKKANDQAQHRALGQETKELEKMRQQINQSSRFMSHYKMLGANKDAIKYLDNQIDEVLAKKNQLVERYSQVTLKESTQIIREGVSIDRKEGCDKLKCEIDKQISFYDEELKNLQTRRGALWDTHAELEKSLLSQEHSKNETLNELYKRHTAILEKVYVRHIDDGEKVARDSIEAGNLSFKAIVAGPIQFLLAFFKIGNLVDSDWFKSESKRREDVQKAEDDLNQSDTESDDLDDLDDVSDSDNELEPDIFFTR